MDELKSIYLLRYYDAANPEAGYVKRVYVECGEDCSDLIKGIAVGVLSAIAKEGGAKTLEEAADEVEEVLNSTFDFYRLSITNSTDRAVILTATSMYDLPCICTKAEEDE